MSLAPADLAVLRRVHLEPIRQVAPGGPIYGNHQLTWSDEASIKRLIATGYVATYAKAAWPRLLVLTDVGKAEMERADR